MKGDFSKDTFRKKKHFHDVRLQQGRVMLDSDWNEQADITTNRIETGAADIIGDAGSPMHFAGFRIFPIDSSGNPADAGTNLKISAGRFYIDGILCENDTDVLFVDQPDFIKTNLPTEAGRYIFYLDVWQRHISVLEDPEIREVALGGPDTTTRSKTVWQVRYFKGNNSNTCADSLPVSITDPSTGQMKARSELPSGTNNPCGLETSGGYRRLENQLYRLEIHRGADKRAKATFKWSRDNGSVQVKWESIDASNPNNLIVSSSGRDELLGFKSGDWIELIDDRTDLLHLPGVLVQLLKVNNNVFTINPDTIKDPDNPTATKVTISNRNPRIRRWDSPGGELSLNTNNNTWVALEDGIEVNFKEGIFKTGDYWLVPARTATANIEWPYIEPQMRQGIIHHYAKLAIADVENGTWKNIKDCRPKFPPLTELISFFYLSGDGQEAMPGHKLQNNLIVGVANGKWPVANAKIKFEIIEGGGALTPKNNSLTNSNGIAECEFKLGKNGNQKVKATLLDAQDSPVHLPIIFTASISLASKIKYDGNGCNKWDNEPHDTVAEAITSLCQRINIQPELESRFKIRDIFWANKLKLFIDQSIDNETLLNGFWIVCNMQIDPQSVYININDKISRALGQLTIEVPYFDTEIKKIEDGQCFGWIGTLPLGVPFEYLLLDEQTIFCKPKNPDCLKYIFDYIQELYKYPPDKLLVRFTLNGNFIWALETGEFLDANLFAKLGSDNCLEPLYESGDGKRGGMLNLRFYLSREQRDDNGGNTEKIKYPFNVKGEINIENNNLKAILNDISNPQISLVGGNLNPRANTYSFQTDFSEISQDFDFEVIVKEPRDRTIITDNQSVHFRVALDHERKKKFIDLSNQQFTLKELYERSKSIQGNIILRIGPKEKINNTG